MQPFPMSPKNSGPAVINMLEKTSCHRFITQSSLPVVSALEREIASSSFQLQVDELPDLFSVFPTLLHDQSTVPAVLPYPPANRSISDDEAVIYLHSSGSTGFPKPIKQTRRTVIEWASSRT